MKALKVRIYPNNEQVDFLNQQFGAVRLVYNKFLKIISSQYKRHNTSLFANRDLKKLLPIAKKSRKYSWLSNYDSISLQQSCINLNKAYQNFFKQQRLKKKGVKISNGNCYPVYKKKHGAQSSYHCTSIKVGDNWIKIPKIRSKIKAKIHRNINQDISSITITRNKTGKHFASIVFKELDSNCKKITDINENNVIGIDMGLSHLLITSNKDKIDNPRFLKLATRNIKRKQKNLSRAAKASKNRAKARLLVAKAHEKLSNKRNDFQHKLSNTIVDDNQAIIVETLKVKNMLKNKKLAKHISDASWSSFIQKLEYKAAKVGKHLIKIDQWYPSSKTCSNCNYKIGKLDLQIRKWSCPECDVEHDRDINASLNIKNKGIEILKAEGMSVSAVGGLRKSA